MAAHGSWLQTLGTKPTLLYTQPVNGLNIRRIPSTVDRVRESLTFARDKNLSAKRLWMNVR
jgi:hypothetical protein